MKGNRHVIAPATLLWLACVSCGNTPTEGTSSFVGLLSLWSGSVLSVRCEQAAHLTVPHSSAWVSTSGEQADTAWIGFAPDRQCRLTQLPRDLRYVLASGHRWSGDSLLGVELRATRAGAEEVRLAVNGRVTGRLELLAASDAFAAAGVGHRGAGYRWPENTLVALRAASQAGLAASEVDVRITRDSVPVLLHDKVLERTTTGVGAVEELTLAEARTADAGVRFDPRFAGERIPTLQEAFELSLATQHPLILDVKNDQRILEHAAEATLIVRMAREAGVEDLVTLLSPEPAFLRAARAESSRIGLAVLVGSGFYPHHLRMAVESQANMIMYPPDSLLQPATLAALDQFTTRGIRIASSTTNRPRLADSVLSIGRASLILTGIPPRMYDYRP